MLDRTELAAVADRIAHGNVGHAETLYLQDVSLGAIYRETADELVFKGGTALRKCYQLDRFSEDLDFTARQHLAWDDLRHAVERDLEAVGATVDTIDDDRADHVIQWRFGVEGPLYMGEDRSRNFVRVQINTDSTVETTELVRYTPPFRDLPTMDLVVLSEPEILAEKMRALMTRSQPRDLYDSYHLINKGVAIDRELATRKLAYYDLEYDRTAVSERIRALEAAWPAMDHLVYGRVPPFEAVATTVTSALPETPGGDG